LTNPDNTNIINFDLWKRAASGRHQIGTMAGFKSEQVAGFLLECVAGFVGIRTPSSWRGLAGIGGAEFRRRCEGVFSAKRVKTAFGELAGRRG
jgi:hypothetical protein